MNFYTGVMNDGGTCIVFKLNLSEDRSNYTSYDLVFQVNQVMSLSLIRDNLKVKSSFFFEYMFL